MLLSFLFVAKYAHSVLRSLCGHVLAVIVLCVRDFSIAFLWRVPFFAVRSSIAHSHKAMHHTRVLEYRVECKHVSIVCVSVCVCVCVCAGYRKKMPGGSNMWGTPTTNTFTQKHALVVVVCVFVCRVTKRICRKAVTCGARSPQRHSHPGWSLTSSTWMHGTQACWARAGWV